MAPLVPNFNRISNWRGFCLFEFFILGLSVPQFGLCSIEILKIGVTLDQILIDVAREIRSRSLLNVEKHKEGLHETLSFHLVLKVSIFQQPPHDVVEETVHELRMENLVKAHVLIHGTAALFRRRRQLFLVSPTKIRICSTAWWGGWRNEIRASLRDWRNFVVVKFDSELLRKWFA